MHFLSLLLYLPSLIICQQRKDYIILTNKDTIFTQIVRIDKKMKSVVCEPNGKKTIYKAKYILELKLDTFFYETGFVQLKKSKQFVLLRRTCKGKLSLYETCVRHKQVLWGNIAENFIHVRWVYRAQKWVLKNYITIYFYKKENESNTGFSRSWQEKTKDCNTLNDRRKSLGVPWSPLPIELVQFYNSNCK